jgi:uncharacterized protein (TIGR02246 family)
VQPLNSDRLNRWLTLGANVAVLIGIALLLVELKQNRDMVRAQTRHELSMGIVDLLQTAAANERLADVLLRAQSGDWLTATEQLQFQMRTNALFRYWEDVHYQYRAGLYDDVEFARQRGAWRASLAGSRLGQRYWCQVRSLYSPQFMAEMDSLLDPACSAGDSLVNPAAVKAFANRYTAAWNSREPANVATFFAPDGSLSVNGSLAAGRDAITDVARGFMDAFPDLELRMDALEFGPDFMRYHWTFAGTNTGPGGTGNAVRFSGYEEWTLGADGLIAQSRGHFDNEEYQLQLQRGAGPERP